MWSVVGSVILGSGICHFWLGLKETWLALLGSRDNAAKLLPHSLAAHLPVTAHLPQREAVQRAVSGDIRALEL